MRVAGVHSFSRERDAVLNFSAPVYRIAVLYKCDGEKTMEASENAACLIRNSLYY